MMLFNQLARMEAGQMSGAMVGGILLGYGITYLFAYVVFSSLLRRRWEESSVFALLSSFPNAAFMGLPIVVLLLPDSSEAAIVASLCAVMTSAEPAFHGRQAGKPGNIRARAASKYSCPCSVRCSTIPCSSIRRSARR